MAALVTPPAIQGDSALLLRNCSKERSSFYGPTGLLSLQTLRLWERGHRAQETISRLPALPRGPEEGACPRSVSRCLRVKSDGWFPPSQGSMGPSAGPETGQPWRSPARGGQRLAPCTRRRNKSNSAKVRPGAGRRRVCPALPSSAQHQMGGLGQGDTPA